MKRLTARALLELASEPTFSGRIAAVLLMTSYAGRHIPRLPLHVKRDNEIRAALDRGESYRSVAKRYHISRRQVTNIAKRPY